MDKNFTSLLKQFIDCYIADPLAIEVGLSDARVNIESGTFGESYEGEDEARRLSVRRAYSSLHERLLSETESRSEPKTGGAPAGGQGGLSDLTRIFTLDDWEEQRFNAFLNKLARAFDMPRESLDRWIKEKGYTKEQLAEVERDPQWRKKEAEYDFGFDSQPNLQVALAKEFADWLDVAVSKIEGIEEISYRESIPTHLQHYLHEAYRCDIYGLDAACAALCGSILQEAIRFRLGLPGLTGLDEAIRDATDNELLNDETIEAADKVKSLRDLAAHGNRLFSMKTEEARKSALPLTRLVLDNLFPTKA